MEERKVMVFTVSYYDYKKYWQYHPGVFAFKDTYDVKAKTIKIRAYEKTKTSYDIVEYGFLLDENVFNCISDSYDCVASEFSEDVNEIMKRVTKVKVLGGGRLKTCKPKYFKAEN